MEESCFNDPKRVISHIKEKSKAASKQGIGYGARRHKQYLPDVAWGV